MLLHQLQNGFQPPGVGVLGGGQVTLAAHQSGQKQQQFALYAQLIAHVLDLVELLGRMQTVRRPIVAPVVRGQAHGQGQAAALQGQQVFFRRHVTAAAQQLQIKNDIFVLHPLVVQLAQGVEYAGGKHIDVPGRGSVAGKPRLHDAASFFDEHQLHAVLPVQCHLGKIHRDGAGVDVEREPRCAVLFGFPQGWLIFHRFALHDRIVP